MIKKYFVLGYDKTWGENKFKPVAENGWFLESPDLKDTEEECEFIIEELIGSPLQIPFFKIETIYCNESLAGKYEIKDF
jgi:hypothetical protein